MTDVRCFWLLNTTPATPQLPQYERNFMLNYARAQAFYR